MYRCVTISTYPSIVNKENIPIPHVKMLFKLTWEYTTNDDIYTYYCVFDTTSRKEWNNFIFGGILLQELMYIYYFYNFLPNMFFNDVWRYQMLIIKSCTSKAREYTYTCLSKEQWLKKKHNCLQNTAE